MKLQLDSAAPCPAGPRAKSWRQGEEALGAGGDGGDGVPRGRRQGLPQEPAQEQRNRCAHSPWEDLCVFLINISVISVSRFNNLCIQITNEKKPTS